jgi:4'-phosphopantetheinyl transferase
MRDTRRPTFVTPERSLNTRPGHVDLWATALDPATPTLARLERLLDADERARAARFVFAPDARRFRVARGTLREILGGYLGVAPADVRFAYAAAGKPALAAPFTGAGVEFNLSHSGEIALYAIADQRRIGIDVEQIRPLDDMEALAERNFSAAERRALFAVAPAQRAVAFFACWTRKEAYIKALGDGLGHPLDSLTVSLGAGEPARFLEIGGEPAAAARWTLAALDVGAGYEAAVAVDGPATVRLRGYWEQSSSS